MKCCDPVYIKAPVYEGCHSYLGTNQYKYIPVPCGKCFYCLRERQQDWITRLLCEQFISDCGYFITLTYNDENLHELDVKELQRFFHSLRVWYHRNVDSDAILTYYAVGEYGREGNRPHYHIMLFGLPWKPLQEVLPLIERFWHKGFCYVKRTDMHNIGYITKYLSKLDPREHEQPPFRCLVGDPLWDYVISHLAVFLESRKEISRLLDYLMEEFADYQEVGKISFVVPSKRSHGKNLQKLKSRLDACRKNQFISFISLRHTVENILSECSNVLKVDFDYEKE